MYTSRENRQVDRNGGAERHYTFVRKKQENPSCMASASQFIAKRYNPKHNQALEGCKDFQVLELDKEECIKYILECANTFARIHNTEYKPIKQKGFTKNLKSMYEFVKGLLPEYRVLNVDYADGKLMFIESERLEFPNSEVFFLPVCCLDHFTGSLRELMIRLFCNISNSQGFEFPEDHWDFQYCLELMDDEEVIEEKSGEYYEFYKAYRNGGHIHSLMSEIMLYGSENNDYRCRKKTNELVLKVLEEGHSDVKNLPRLLQVIEDGMELMQEADLSRFDYHPEMSITGDFDNEEFTEGYIMIDRLMCFTYGSESNDPIVKAAIGVLNSDASNFAEFVMYDVHPLKPTDREKWTPSDFPHRFNEWYNRLYLLIEDYEPRLYSE